MKPGNDMDECYMHIKKWSKLVSKDSLLYDSSYVFSKNALL